MMLRTWNSRNGDGFHWPAKTVRFKPPPGGQKSKCFDLEALGSRRCGRKRMSGEVFRKNNAMFAHVMGESVRRIIRMSRLNLVFKVREEITNDHAIGRIFNIVQHPTIAPPFLDEDTIVSCNGRRG